MSAPVAALAAVAPQLLQATGQENAWLLPVALIAGGLVVVGVVIVIVRAVRSRRSGTP